jgi:hypothetical protein
MAGQLFGGTLAQEKRQRRFNPRQQVVAFSGNPLENPIGSPDAEIGRKLAHDPGFDLADRWTIRPLVCLPGVNFTQYGVQRTRPRLAGIGRQWSRRGFQVRFRISVLQAAPPSLDIVKPLWSRR